MLTQPLWNEVKACHHESTPLVIRGSWCTHLDVHRTATVSFGELPLVALWDNVLVSFRDS